MCGDENDTKNVCFCAESMLQEQLPYLVNNELCNRLKQLVFFDDINQNKKTHVIVLVDRDTSKSRSKTLHAPEYSSKEILDCFLRVALERGLVSGERLSTKKNVRVLLNES